jgi:eukaryotic-like serine/threonine-protein kinase
MKDDPQRSSRVTTILSRALELDPRERPAYLDRACADDAELRREIEGLAGRAAHTRDFLEQPAAEYAAPLFAHLMTPHAAGDVLLRLQAALGDRYRLDGELPGGGMSRVFVGEELGLGRRVVLKVLPPELTVATSVERFRQEIHLAASLQHPHIVPLLTAGEADGLLYYTMPLVDGESLRHRLGRLGPLAIDEAVRVIREITAALGYAHRRGIVHRDIKPGNILLTEDAALVLDFGVAKALGLPRGTPAPLTMAGLALGTPAYMAPEQAAGDDRVDHRADLYALGCVAYEMVSGRPPFERPSLQAMLVAHATETPAPIASLRADLPPALADLITRLLAKSPADRPESADDVLHLLEDASVAGRRTVAVRPRASAPRWRRWAGAGAAVAVAAALVTVLTRHGHPARLDPHLVAIAPFLVSTADSSLAYLSEGMVDLLATKLNGTADLRAADPRTLLSTSRHADRAAMPVRDEAIAQARRVRAGRIIQGEVVGTGASLMLSASVVDVSSGEVQTQTSVEGSPDSVTRLVDRLAAQLLALGAGESAERLTTLTSTSLTAVRAYLNGQSLLRHGLFARAVDQFELALQLDSTFALAGLRRDRAVEWVDDRDASRGSRIAWRHRERLSARDRAQLSSMLGPRFPARSDRREILEAAEGFVRAAPDSPEAWYGLGDYLFHYGGLLGIEDAFPRASAAFGRALALDSSFAPALEHGPVLAFELGDTAELRRAVRRFLAVDSTSARAAVCRWYLAAALGDSVALQAALRDDSLPSQAFGFLIVSLNQGIGTGQVRQLIARARRAAITAERRMWLDDAMYDLLQFIGRPLQARAFLESEPAKYRNLNAVSVGLFGDGDSATMAESATALARELGSPLRATDETAVNSRYLVGQYALAQGRLVDVRQAIADLRASPIRAESAWAASPTRDYALILEAQLAARQGSPDAGRLLAELDSTLLTAPEGPSLPGNLVAARLHEQRGELAAALAAVRRRVFGLNPWPENVTYVREEGRLAALTGDRAGAARAYRRYLAIRIDPEPRLRAQVAQVRADMTALGRAAEGGPAAPQP